MSALKKLIHSLVKVIVSYYDIKSGNTTIDKLNPIDKLLEMNPGDLNATLAKIIEETAKIKETRVNFLSYLATIIKDIKPLVDQEEPLTGSELLVVKKTIIDLISHSQQLSPLSHSALFNFEYNGTKISAFGFETGYIKVSPCTTGDLVRRSFPVPGLTLTPAQYPISEITVFVETMVTEHQNYLLSHQEVASLKQENATLTARNNDLETENQALLSQVQSLQQQLEPLHIHEPQEQAPPSKPPAIPYPPFFYQQGLSGLLSHVFFRKKNPASSDLGTQHAISRHRLGGLNDIE